MNEELIAHIDNAVKEAVKETVNGKIDRLTEAFNKHVEEHKADQQEIKDLLQAKNSLAFIFKGVLGAGSLAAAYLAIRSALGR